MIVFHEVEYVEGVLLSINSLSVNIGDSMRRVNAAIDRLLENHLSAGFVQRKYNEEDITALPFGGVGLSVGFCKKKKNEI